MIKFYNHFGFGDIFISREFVKQICDYFGVSTEFSTYYHNKDFKFFIDIIRSGVTFHSGTQGKNKFLHLSCI